MNNLKPCKAEYVSDKASIFFKKGETYKGYLLEKNPKVIAFYFPEEDMDESGYFALPIERFEILEG